MENGIPSSDNQVYLNLVSEINLVTNGEKRLSKHIDIGSSFEDLATVKPTVKADHQSG